MNNIKVGDKLFSKKSDDYIFKHEYYTITRIGKSSREIYGLNTEIKIPIYVQVSDNKTFLHDFIHNELNNEDYIWNYFYTPNELRKEKIKKLNE
jgi:hypothetical protein